MKKSILIILICIFAIGVILYGGKEPASEQEEDISEETGFAPEIAYEDLYVPWSILRLPDGRLIIAERSGNLNFIQDITVTIRVPDVVESGEGGLMGMALHPDFEENNFLYLYFTAKSEGQTINRVVRFVLDGSTLTFDKTIVDFIPGGSNHNGGRIAFGPDRKLYITTGDSGNSALAQDIKSFAGKILRINDDGKIPDDNPFETQIYSYGHRNPQGLAWDDQGRLWSIEHGRSGVQSGFDEINLIEKGGNYGWPEIQGSTEREGMITPVANSGATVTWAPANLVFYDGRLFFTGLRGQTLYEVTLLRNGGLSPVKEHFKSEYGRLRALFLDENGDIYFGTSNKDGRGRPKAGDDKIFKVRF